MKLIPLSQGKFAQVDNEDFEFLNKHKWCLHKGHKTDYAKRNGGNGKVLLMHHVVLDVVDGCIVDHENHNGLDNQKNNLRKSTHANNIRNATKKVGGASQYIGVGWYKKSNKWRAQITLNYKQIHLGHYSNEEQAAIEYNNAAKKYFGEFANLNIITDLTVPLHVLIHTLS